MNSGTMTIYRRIPGIFGFETGLLAEALIAEQFSLEAIKYPRESAQPIHDHRTGDNTPSADRNVIVTYNAPRESNES